MIEGKILKLIVGGILGVCAIVLFLSTYYTVDQYERAVLTRFGKVVAVSEPGLHFKLPFVNYVHTYRIDILSIQPKEAVNTYTVDNQEVDVVFNVFYRIPPDRVAYVYQNVQDYYQRLFNMAVDRLKSEMGKVNVQHVAEQRGAIRDKIKTVLAQDAKELGVEVTDFMLTNLEYSKSFRGAVEAAAAAKATVETREQERLQSIKVAEAKVIAAKGVGDAAREQARGEADGIKMRGEAQAAAIKAQAEALASNAKLVELRKAEKWDGKLPLQMLSGVIPFMNYEAAK
jgi:regulator of protease activity HflC (stomatin/prohibitin superfamily)